MDSKAETATTKPKTPKFGKNLESKECVRPFKLQQHYPSTLSALRKSEIHQDSRTMQAKGVSNIISALPLSNNMTFIPNKEMQASEVQNVQKLKFKSLTGKDIAEVKMNVQKGFTLPKIIQKSNKFSRVVAEGTQVQKPKIKTVTQILPTSPSKEQCNKSGEALLSNATIQIVNGEKKLTINPAVNSSKQIVIQSTSGDVIKKIVSPNVICSTQQNTSQFLTLKPVPGYPNVLMFHNDNSQLVAPASEKLVLLKNNVTNNQLANKNDNKVIIQTLVSNSSIRKRDGSSLDQSNSTEIKKSRRDVQAEVPEINQGFNNTTVSKEFVNISEMKNSQSQTLNTATKKDIMVVVPSDAAKELAMTFHSSNTSNEDLILDEASEITFLHDEDVGVTDNHDQDTQTSSKKNVDSTNQEEADSSMSISNVNPDTHNSTSENLLDRFSILEKAVLSVQDENLREKALKALKDCGIQKKKKVLIKKPIPTKVINESAVQTSVFSLLKEGEFLEVDEAHPNLNKIKLNRKFPKHPISTLGITPQQATCQNMAEFKEDLDSMLEKINSNNKSVSDVKNALMQNKKMQAKRMLERLLKDFEAAKNYNNDGYLGIHKAVANNNLQDVQKHIIILRAAKQNIDVCTEQGQTSLELAVELEVDSQIIKILLENGAQPVSSKPVHDSALILAAKKSSRVLPLLLKHIDRNHQTLINAKSSEGLAAIHYCAQFGNLEGITELIRHGADVNLQDERSGRTALFYAVDTKNGDVPQDVYNEIAQKLVDNGAYSNIPTFSKHSVLTLIDDVKSHTLKIALNRAVR